MRSIITYTFIFTIVFNFISCKPSTYFKSDNSSLKIDSTTTNHKLAENLIKPYKIKLEAEMNEVLVISADEFPKERGKSETKLGNLVADLSLDIGNNIYTTNHTDSIDFCLLNFGGLRTSLPKGDITRGKIFELMPFENELVVITLSIEKTTELLNYLKRVGGQPISGFRINTVEQNTIDIFQYWSYNGNDKQIKVITSDYLANGGDNMTFFLNPIKTEPLNIKLRDAIIQHCKEQNKKGNQLTGKIDGRIVYE